MNATCLVDFFNLQLWKPHRPPDYADIRSGLEQVVQSALDGLSKCRLDTRELRVRLYGGWHGDSVRDRVPIRELTAAVVGKFPLHSGHRTRLRIELAETPIWDRSLRLLRTLRDVPLKPPSCKVAAPSHCGNRSNCEVSHLSNWMRGYCPGSNCTVRYKELGSTFRQKMVDTLIIADALSLVNTQQTDILIIAGDDDDLMPALLALNGRRITGIRLKRQASNSDYYDGILEHQGIHTLYW